MLLHVGWMQIGSNVIGPIGSIRLLVLHISHYYNYFVFFKPGRKIDWCNVSKNDCFSTISSFNEHEICFSWFIAMSELHTGSKQKEQKRTNYLQSDTNDNGQHRQRCWSHRRAKYMAATYTHKSNFRQLLVVCNKMKAFKTILFVSRKKDVT